MLLSDSQNLNFLTKLSSKLSDTHSITSYEYEIFNLIKSSQNNLNDINIKKSEEENNLNEEKIENRIIKEKIKANIEKILSYIKDKKDYEFISDFFIDESEINNNSISDNVMNENKENKKNNLEPINDNLMDIFSENNLFNINSLITFNKKLNQKIEENYSSLNLKKNTNSSELLFLNDIEKVKNFKNKKNSEENIKSKEEMDQEMEEEINKQIFGYTKKMKESAKNFGVQLKKDNKILNNIEDLQDKINTKTTKETSRLKKFNFSIKLGFCQLFILIITVITIFFITLFIIKIFPKLA